MSTWKKDRTIFPEGVQIAFKKGYNNKLYYSVFSALFSGKEETHGAACRYVSAAEKTTAGAEARYQEGKL